MPKGVPVFHLPDMATLVSSLQSTTQYAIEYLEIPNYGLVKEHFLIALYDIIKSTQSAAAFIRLTSRPFVILFALISRYILIVLRVIAEHTVYHGILALKEAWRQFLFASKWFVRYQKSLSQTAINMEIAFVFLLIGLYAIRKHIKRKKYVERVTRWYRAKKSIAVMKYNRLVDNVAQTSVILALLLPHVFYVVSSGLIKWFLPSVVGYFANKTLLADLISFYYPFVKTVIVIHKWRSYGLDAKLSKAEKTDGEQEGDKKIANKSASAGIMSMFRRKKVGSEYEKAISSKRQNETQSAPKSKAKTIRTHISSEQHDVIEEASNLLQYWIVYAFMFAIMQTMMLLPVFGRILSNVNVKAEMVSSLPWKQKKATTWLNRINIKPSSESIYECKLFFFIWLRLLPTSLTGSNKSMAGENKKERAIVASNSVLSRVSALEKSVSRPRERKQIKVPFSNRPIDIIYERLSPLVIALVSSSTHLLQNSKDDESDDSGGPRSLVMRAVAWCKKLLDVMVWTKMISKQTKGRIIATLVECSDLLPALVTFLMPSYFTNYGIIYIQLVVPSATSANSYDALKRAKTNTETVRIMAIVVRYLQYWVLHGIVSWTISAFTPVLAWIPLSTHIIWIIWAYMQLEGTVVYLYGIFEWDLVAFGLLKSHPHQKDLETMDVNGTVTMKVFNSIIKRVPSSLHSKESLASDGEAMAKKDQSSSEREEGGTNRRQEVSEKPKIIRKEDAKEKQVIEARKEEQNNENLLGDADYVRVNSEQDATDYLK